MWILCSPLRNFNLKNTCKRNNFWKTASIRFILHHCVVIFFWSSGIMECTCVLFAFGGGVLLVRWGASVVWRRSLPLMNGFNVTEAAVFSHRLCFLRAFPFVSFIFGMLIYYIKTQVKFDLGYNPFSFFGVMGLL